MDPRQKKTPALWINLDWRNDDMYTFVHAQRKIINNQESEIDRQRAKRHHGRNKITHSPPRREKQCLGGGKGGTGLHNKSSTKCEL